MTTLPLDPNTLYSAGEVARLVFGRSADWFYRHRRVLRAEDCFPHAITHRGRPRYLGAVLIAWAARPQIDAAAYAPAPRPLPPGVADFSAELAARAEAVARSGRRRSPQDALAERG